MELEIIKFFQSSQNAFFDVFFSIASLLASWVGFVIVFVVIFLYNKKYGLYFSLCYGASVGINWIFKILINRPRPYEIDNQIVNVTNSLGKSLPSGHMLGAVVLCFFVLFFVCLFFEKPKLHHLCFCSIFLICVAISRMYFGQHYITDIIAGGALGIALCVAWFFLWKYSVSKITISRKKGNK